MGRLYNDAVSFENQWKACADENSHRVDVSVIIPVYRPTHLDAVLRQLNEIGNDVEVVLVDDSGDGLPLAIGEYPKLRLKLIRHLQNYGRPVARNTGAAYASGDVLVFMDQDMILAPDFFSNVIQLLIDNNGKGIALGLRDTLPFEQIPTMENWHSPAPSRDWRVSTPVMDTFIDLTVAGVGSATNHCDPLQMLNIYDRTNQLRDLGVAPAMTIGFWDLPSMVISHSMAISKDEFLKIGGFPQWISGWGGEDIVIGFSAVAAHNPIMMTDSVSYHIQHPPYSGSEQQKNIELMQNIARYRQWAQTADSFPQVDLAEWRRRGCQISH